MSDPEPKRKNADSEGKLDPRQLWKTWNGQLLKTLSLWWGIASKRSGNATAIVLSATIAALLFVTAALLLMVLATFPTVFFAERKAEFTVELRWHALAFVTLLGGLAALVGLPLTVIRTVTNDRQANTAQEGHVTDRINKAVEGLGAEKEVNRLGRNVRWTEGGERQSGFEWYEERLTVEHDDGTEIERDAWKPVTETRPNIEVRVGAIYALERISQDSDRDHLQVMEILCTYIRENAPADSAPDHDLGNCPGRPELMNDAACTDRQAALDQRRKELLEWIDELSPPRTDIQTALTVIGRREEDRVALERWTGPKGNPGPHRLDLRGANLRKCNLSGWTFDGAILMGARLEGADLSGTRLKQADLRGARLQGAKLSGARLREANFEEARLEGADINALMWAAELRWTQLEGANLNGARLKGADLAGARLEGADLRRTQLEGADLSWSYMAGTAERPICLYSTNIAGASNNGGALRFADLRSAIFDDRFSLRYHFGDATVLLPNGVERPRQWACAELSDTEFFGRWRGWIEAAPRAGPGWSRIAPEGWEDVEAIPPPKGCAWKD